MIQSPAQLNTSSNAPSPKLGNRRSQQQPPQQGAQVHSINLAQGLTQRLAKVSTEPKLRSTAAATAEALKGTSGR